MFYDQWKRFIAEFEVVKSAPRTFVTALAVALLPLGTFLWWVLSDLKGNQLANKDTLIATKDGTSSFLQTQLNELHEKLKAGSQDEALKKLAQLEKRERRGS
jgi:hypothetical protein